MGLGVAPWWVMVGVFNGWWGGAKGIFVGNCGHGRALIFSVAAVTSDTA